MVKTCWYNTVKQIGEKVWNDIFSNELLKSYALFKTMEDAFIRTIKYHYLCVLKGDEIISIFPCFEYFLNLDVVSSDNFQSKINMIRKYKKDFFSVKVFVLGSYVATCEQYIGVKKGFEQENFSIISEEIKLKSRKLKCHVTMIKEIPESQFEMVKKIFNDFIFVDSLPNSYVPTSFDFRPYPSTLARKAKQRFNRAKRDFEKNKLKFELINDFKAYTKIACKLYMNVLKKSNTKFECLNETFFEKINEYMKEESHLLLIKDQQNNILSAELILKCKKKLIPIYIGIDYSYFDVKCLYFNTIAHSIELAEENNLDYVVLGQNSYFPKSLSGAIIERGFLGFYSSSFTYSFIINKFSDKLFPKFINKAGLFYDKKATASLEKFCRENKIIMLPDQRVPL